MDVETLANNIIALGNGSEYPIYRISITKRNYSTGWTAYCVFGSKRDTYVPEIIVDAPTIKDALLDLYTMVKDAYTNGMDEREI